MSRDFRVPTRFICWLVHRKTEWSEIERDGRWAVNYCVACGKRRFGNKGLGR